MRMSRSARLLVGGTRRSSRNRKTSPRWAWSRPSRRAAHPAPAAAPTLAGGAPAWAARWGVGGATGGEDAVVALPQPRRRQPLGVGGAGGGGLAAGDRKPLGQLRGPPLPRLLADPLELPDKMRRAQRMRGGGVAPVRRPAVMHRQPAKARQHPGGVHRRHPPLGMHREQAQQLGGRRMDGSAAGPRPWRRSRRSGRPRRRPAARAPARQTPPAPGRPRPAARQATPPTPRRPPRRPAARWPAGPARAATPQRRPPARGPPARSTPPRAPPRETPQR